MESPFDDDIGDIANTPSLEQAERYSAKRQRWEANVVKRILAYAGKDRLAPELIRRHFERTAEHRLTFDAFKMECPEFPMRLGFEKPSYKALEQVEKQILQGRKANNNILTKLWAEYHDSVPYAYKDCYQGVVFEWLHHGSPYKLIHNQYLYALPFPSVRIAISLPGPLTLYLEDLDSYLSASLWARSQ